jgi:hypothetical protein
MGHAVALPATQASKQASKQRALYVCNLSRYSQEFLSQYEDASFEELSGADARKVWVTGRRYHRMNNEHHSTNIMQQAMAHKQCCNA